MTLGSTQRLGLDPLHCSDTYPTDRSDLPDTVPASLQGLPDGLLNVGWDRRPPQFLAAGTRPGEPSLDPLLDHGAFELGEGPHHLEHGPACRGGRVEALLMQVEIDPLNSSLMIRDP